VLPRRVAPPVGVAVVGRAEVGRRDGDGRRPRLAVLRPRRVAGDEVARAAGGAVAVQRRAQRRRLRPVPGAVQVAVPARPACMRTRSTSARASVRRTPAWIRVGKKMVSR
jgi:hypothetical protein